MVRGPSPSRRAPSVSRNTRKAPGAPSSSPRGDENRWRWPLRCVCAIAVAATALRCADASARDELARSVDWHSSHIDWCEANYEVTGSVSEFWNTWSNLLTIPPVLLAWQLHRPFVAKVDAGFAFCLVALLCVSIGSMYFHATLSTLGQVLDEMCICWANYYAILLVCPRKDFAALVGEGTRRAVFSVEALGTVVLVTPVWALFYPIVSHILTVATIVLLPGAIIYQYRVYAAKVSPEGWRVLRLAVSFHCSAVTCWVVDRVACDAIPRALGGFNPQLHAWWHVLVFLGAYLTIVGVCYIRCVGDGHRVEVRRIFGGLPYTAIAPDEPPPTAAFGCIVG